MIVNENYDFNSAPADVRQAFFLRGPEHRMLPNGFELYKFSAFPVFKSDGTASPWWSSVQPLNPNTDGRVRAFLR